MTAPETKCTEELSDGELLDELDQSEESPPPSRPLTRAQMLVRHTRDVQRVMKHTVPHCNRQLSEAYTSVLVAADLIEDYLEQQGICVSDMDPAEVQQVIELIDNAEYPSGNVLSSAVEAPMYRGLPSAAQVSMYHCLPSATQSPMYRGLPSAAQVSMYRCLPSATQPPNRGSEAPPDGHRLAAVFMRGLQQMARDEPQV